MKHKPRPSDITDKQFIAAVVEAAMAYGMRAADRRFAELVLAHAIDRGRIVVLRRECMNLLKNNSRPTSEGAN